MGNGRSPSDTPSNGVPIEDASAVDTGVVSTEFHVAAQSMAQDQLIDAVAEKLARKLAGGGGTIPPPSGAPPPGHKTFLGLDAGGWTRMLMAWVVGVALAFGAWWLTVRDGLRERPTEERVDKKLEKAVNGHEANGNHPKIEKRLDALGAEQKMIRETQIEQTQVDKQQTEVLKDIKAELRRRRR